jgi:hypothetical protein
MIYIAIMGFLIIAQTLSSNAQSAIGLLRVMCIFFLVYIGLRRDVGCDFDGYYLIFSLSEGLSLPETTEFMEVGFAVLIRLIQEAGLDFYWLNLVCAAIFLYGAYKLSARQPSPLGFFALSFPILMLHMAMSATRQATAIGILMLAFIAFTEKKRIGFVTFVLLAASFHTSAITFLPLAFLIGRPVSVMTLAAAFAVVAPVIFIFSGTSVETYRARYVESELSAAGGLVRGAMVTAAGLMFLFTLRRPWQRMYPRDYDITRILALMTIPLVPLSLVSSVIADRFGYYLMPAQLMIFARIPYLRGSDAIGQLLSLAPWVMLVGFLVVWILFSPIAAECYLPYDNYLF